MKLVYFSSTYFWLQTYIFNRPVAVPGNVKMVYSMAALSRVPDTSTTDTVTLPVPCIVVYSFCPNPIVATSKSNDGVV